MKVVYHFKSATEITTDIIDSIKIVFKGNSIVVIV